MAIGIPHLGVRVSHRSSGGAPVDPNLLAPFAWEAGTNTTMSTVGDFQRATAIGANNPRIYKHVTGLVNGATYLVTGTMNQGTMGASVRFRVSTNVNLPDGNLTEQTGSGPGVTINDSFVAEASGECYVGIVGVAAGGSNEFCEVSTDLMMVLVP